MQTGSVSHKKSFDTRTRNSLMSASMLGPVPGFVLAALLGLAASPNLGIDLAVGCAVVALPHAWFVMRGTRAGDPPAAAFLALGKYGLVGAGYAMWFYARPEAHVLVTVGGSALTIALTTLATWWLLGQTKRDPQRESS